MATTAETVSGRTLHLIDLENLAGDPAADPETALRTFDRYLALACWQDGDLVYVATNPALASQICWDMPIKCNFRTACGPDGADNALLRNASPEFVARRVRRMVIGSGDHIFIRRAVAVRELGVGVGVVSRPSSLHSGWVAWGFPVIELDVPDSGDTTALPRLMTPPARPTRRRRARRREPVRAA
jgi:hypothetical protein